VREAAALFPREGPFLVIPMLLAQQGTIAGNGVDPARAVISVVTVRIVNTATDYMGLELGIPRTFRYALLPSDGQLNEAAGSPKYTPALCRSAGDS
jgi:hypothetical protein